MSDEMTAVLDEPPVFVMPEISVSDIVLWYDNGDLGSAGHAALVTRKGAESVDLTVYGEGVSDRHKRGVRFHSDPKMANVFQRDAGGWDYSPAAKRLMRIEQMLNEAGFGETPKAKKR